MKIVISSGHGKYVSGASGFLDEVAEARRVVDRVAKLLRSANIECVTFHDDTSQTQSENLDAIVDFHNSQKRDLDVSTHFNCYETTDQPRGTECLYVTQQDIASAVSAAVAEAGSLIDRGAKYRDDLAFLNKTEMPAILIEVCFVDSSQDASLYEIHFHAICEAIAKAIAGISPP
jgi:N-acetylmuramoyl-L-alanine amidase